MHPRTADALNDLDQADWFSRVGVKDTEVAIVLDSWPDAIEQCSDLEWQDLGIHAANQLCERILERSKERFQRWNDICIEMKKTTEPFVRKKIAAVVREFELPPIFEHSVQWDILHLCMEAEYADVFPPAYYASQAYWYVNGHFPCGWQGDFPDGMLIIY